MGIASDEDDGGIGVPALELAGTNPAEACHWSHVEEAHDLTGADGFPVRHNLRRLLFLANNTYLMSDHLVNEKVRGIAVQLRGWPGAAGSVFDNSGEGFYGCSLLRLRRIFRNTAGRTIRIEAEITAVGRESSTARHDLSDDV